MKTLATKVMIATCCTFAAVASAPAQVSAQTITGDKQQVLWDKLAVDIREIDRNLDGVMGVAIEDLTSGQKFFLHEDAAFPQASSIKIAVLAELYPKAKLTDLYTVESKDLVQDSDLMLGLTPGVIRVTNRDLATMMVAVSDNSAANVLIDRQGMENVNALMDTIGLTHPRLRRKMMDIKAAGKGRENGLFQSAFTNWCPMMTFLRKLRIGAE